MAGLGMADWHGTMQRQPFCGHGTPSCTAVNMGKLPTPKSQENGMIRKRNECIGARAIQAKFRDCCIWRT